MKKLDGIIFDLDSTLVDVDLDFNGIRDALGIPQPHPILEWLEGLEDQELKKRLEQELYQFELQAAKNKKVIDHVPEMLSFLKSKNLKLAVLTRNCKEVAHLELEGMKHFFDPIFSREDHLNCKPGPDGVLSACRLWGTKPENVIMIGDYLFDLQAGHNAGAKSFWYANPKYKGRDFSSAADYSFSCWEKFIRELEPTLSSLKMTI